MDISPLAELPPPRLRTVPPPAATRTPVARRALNPYLVRDPPSGQALGLGPNYPMSRAIALVSGDKSIPYELLPRLNAVLRETRLAGGVYLRDVVRFATGDYSDPAPPPRAAVTKPTGTRVKAMARRSRTAAPQVADPAPPAAMPRALTQLTLPPSPPPRGSSMSASPSDFDTDDLSVVLDTGSEADLSASEAPDSRCPSPPAAAPLDTSPSPPPARPTSRRLPSADPAPAVRPTIQWPPRAKTSLLSDDVLARHPPSPAQ
jgi:CBS domain-containing protein